MANVQRPEEGIPAEIHRLRTNLVEALRVTWRRPERQKASQTLRHHLYNTLRFANDQLEKTILALSTSPATGQQSQSQPADSATGGSRPPEHQAASRD